MNKKTLEIGSIVLVIAIIILGSILIKDNTNEEQNDVNTVEDNVNINNDDVEKNEKNITIVVFDKESQTLYSGDVVTEAVYLIDALKEVEELNVVSEDGVYGAYIISINEISQGDNYYWTYYIDDEYASVGVSGCEIEEGKTYTFKIEEYNY